MINDNPSAIANEILHKIAVAQAEAGDFKEALATVAGYGNDAWKSDVLATIARIQARLGDIPGALAVTRSIHDLSKAANAYSFIASIQARAGDHRSALDMGFATRQPGRQGLCFDRHHGGHRRAERGETPSRRQAVRIAAVAIFRQARSMNRAAVQP